MVTLKIIKVVVIIIIIFIIYREAYFIKES